MRPYLIPLVLGLAACSGLEQQAPKPSQLPMNRFDSVQLCKEHTVLLASPEVPSSVFASMIRSHRAALWSVVVRFDLDGTGMARSPRIEESSPGPNLNEYVLAAVRNSTFKVGDVATNCVYAYYNEITAVRR